MQWVPQYRAPFYEALRVRLERDGIDMKLVHGDAPASRMGRRDQHTLEWAEQVPNRFWTIAGLELTLQPLWRQWQDADLLVLQQETGLLLNYAALARSRFGGPLVALWGHGHNFNPMEASSLAEWVKGKVTPHADWLFAYTERSATVMRQLGASADRITVVQNAIDTGPLTMPSGPISDELARLLAEVRARHARVGWMVSALDQWKRVPFLLAVVDAIRAQVPNFEFFVLGAGTESAQINEAAESRSWLHMMGPVFGADKAAIGQLAEVTVHPGLAGLHVAEAFATASPMITADLSYHSHEVDYLEHDINALVVAEFATPEEFATVTIDLLLDAERLERLQDGCHRSTTIYTLEAMVDRFATGIADALALRSQRG